MFFRKNPAPVEPPQPMPEPVKWEYLMLHYVDGMEETLNSCGNTGWELVAVSNGVFYMKRSR